MALQNNPIFRLASDVARGVLSRDEAFERAASPEFLKTLKNKTFEEIIRASYSNFLQTDAELPPPEMTTLALTSARTKGLRGELWGMLNSAHASTLLEKGELETAEEYGACAKALIEKARSPYAMLSCDGLLAAISFYKGNDEQIRKLSERGEQSRKGSFTAATQLRFGLVFAAMGEHEQAIRCFQFAKSQYMKLRKSSSHYRFAFRKLLKRARSELKKYMFLYIPNIIGCDVGIATSLWFLGKYDAAVGKLLTARKHSQQHGLFGMMALTDKLYAIICREMGNYQKAIEIFESYRNTQSVLGPTMLFRSKMLLVGLYQDTERYESARSLIEEMRQSAQDEEALDRIAECDLRLALLYKDLGEVDKSVELLNTARLVFEQRGMHLDVVVCDGELARLNAESGRCEEALAVFQRIKGFRGLFSSSVKALQAGSQYTAYVLWKMGRFEEARQEYATTIDLIEQLRQGSSQLELRASYLEAKRLTYIEAVNCCLDQGDYGAALEYVERLKSRNLAEMLDGRNIAPRNASKTELEEHSRLRLRLRAASHRLSKEHGPSQGDSLLKEFVEAREA